MYKASTTGCQYYGRYWEHVSEISEHLIHTIEDVLLLVTDSPCKEAKEGVQQYEIHAAMRSSNQVLSLVIDNKAP
ncbi:MAG: hypothetical protein ACRBFS_19840 [Aureispira sp.]